MKDNNQVLEIRLNNLTEKEMQRWLGQYRCVAEILTPASADNRTFELAIKGLDPTAARKSLQNIEYYKMGLSFCYIHGSLMFVWTRSLDFSDLFLMSSPCLIPIIP